MGLKYGMWNVATGHDNPDGLKTLDQYFPPLFRNYRQFIKFVPARNEGQEMSGARRLKPIALPNLTIQLPFVRADEYQRVIKYICPGLDALITTHVFDLDTNDWINCNGTFRDDPQAGNKLQGASYDNLEFTIIDLVSL